jgi:hypothetical protein
MAPQSAQFRIFLFTRVKNQVSPSRTIAMASQNKFELKPRCFYFMSQNSITLLSNAFFKTASEGPKTTFFCGCKTRGKIERNGCI